MSDSRRMLVFDSAYTFEMMTQRKLTDLVTCRDLDGYFEQVWTIHPVATIVLPPESDGRYGPPENHVLSERHTVIEGKIGRFERMKAFEILNFLLGQIELLWLLLKLVKKEKIQLIRAEDPLYLGCFSWVLARLTGLPFVVGCWGNPGAVRAYTRKPLQPRLFKRVWVEEFVERFILSRADRVIVQNEDNRGYAISQGAKQENTAIFRLGNALNPVHFTDPTTRPCGRSDLEEFGLDGENTLIMVSRLEALKLPDHLIKMTAELKRKGRKVKALLVGDGTFRAELERLVAELVLGEEVVFCGNRDQDWLSRVMPEIDAVVSPLTGRALAEAALSGTAIIAYDIDWHGELIENGVTGELVPYKDYVGLADAAERIFSSSAYRVELGKAGRAAALAMMDPIVVRDAQIRVYEGLL